MKGGLGFSLVTVRVKVGIGVRGRRVPHEGPAGDEGDAPL